MAKRVLLLRGNSQCNTIPYYVTLKSDFSFIIPYDHNKKDNKKEHLIN